MITLAYINIVVLLILGGVHIFWAMGGTMNPKYTIPTKESGEQLFQLEGALATLVVALALFVFAYFHYASLRCSITMAPIIKLMLLGGAVVFLCRAIGERKYIGFFKRVKNSDFAKYDTQYYSPLCLIIALFSFLTYWNMP